MTEANKSKEQHCCPPCLTAGIINCSDFDRCGNVVSFGPCKKCGEPLILISTLLPGQGPMRQLLAVCINCDVVKERPNG